jgi:hypothetical protein
VSASLAGMWLRRLRDPRRGTAYWTIQIVERSRTAVAFEVLPKLASSSRATFAPRRLWFLDECSKRGGEGC